MSETNYNPLTPEEERVILYKGTERPFTGKFTDNKEEGMYICRRCNAPLYRSHDKFDSHCGWPSFDDEISGAVIRTPDADGRRTEITCAKCGGHLGHVFEGENMTSKNTRHCVNSVSLQFIPAGKNLPGAQVLTGSQNSPELKAGPNTDTAFFASGCFWGTEYHFSKANGVISTAVGFMGGKTSSPSYKEVSKGNTGHAETTEVIFNSDKTDYETLTKLFFETHDPGQTNRQGPDIGTQYRSAIFYRNESQKRIAEKLVDILLEKGHKVVTEVTQAGPFWKAEDYHQQYYEKTGGSPYCHRYEKKF